MMRYYSYLNTAVQLVKSYSGEEPFANYCKKYFAEHNKYGSTDRKQITHLCYCYFRLGKTENQWPLEERMLLGLYLCSTIPNDILNTLKPSWNDTVLLPLNQKHSTLDCFPFKLELSNGIEREVFVNTHFSQPDLFLRLRPHKEKIVLDRLIKKNIPFQKVNASCVALPNGTKIEDIVQLDTDVVVQDYSSQRIENFFRLVKLPEKKKLLVWDCCAASGGKSILVKDVFDNVHITVSDIRSSILINLKKRFTAAGIHHYRSFVQDLSQQAPADSEPPFDLIMADVPCSGSGTWGRTPEQLCFFKEETIEKYNSLQKSIVGNAISNLYAGKYFLYSTCSVFKKENEDIVDYIIGKFSLTLVKMELIKGYELKADTMFAALFIKKPS
jgi:16S rRNA (cytosine967-C5)-methyltransferase